MPKNSNLDSLKSREQDAFHRKQVEFKNYLDAKNRADIAYNAMQSARQECRAAREEMNREYEDMQRSSNNFREVWDEYGRIRDINNARIESLRQEADYEHREMQDCFERASSCYQYGDKSEAPYWSSQGHDHKYRRDNINEEVSRLCQEVKTARQDAECRAPKTDSSAFQRAKEFFNDAKSRQKSAEAEFERLKTERDQYKAKFDSAQAEYLRLKEEFQEKLAQIKQDNQRERDKILDKAGVNWSNREDAKIVKKADGTTQVYYGGLLFGDGLGHGHAALNQFDDKTYDRGAFEKHGSQNFINTSGSEAKAYDHDAIKDHGARSSTNTGRGGIMIYDRNARPGHQVMGIEGGVKLRPNSSFRGEGQDWFYKKKPGVIGHITQFYDDGVRVSRDTRDGIHEENVHWTDERLNDGHADKHKRPND